MEKGDLPKLKACRSSSKLRGALIKATNLHDIPILSMIYSMEPPLSRFFVLGWKTDGLDKICHTLSSVPIFLVLKCSRALAVSPPRALALASPMSLPPPPSTAAAANRLELGAPPPPPLNRGSTATWLERLLSPQSPPPCRPSSHPELSLQA